MFGHPQAMGLRHPWHCHCCWGRWGNGQGDTAARQRDTGVCVERKVRDEGGETGGGQRKEKRMSDDKVLRPKAQVPQRSWVLGLWDGAGPGQGTAPKSWLSAYLWSMPALRTTVRDHLGGAASASCSASEQQTSGRQRNLSAQGPVSRLRCNQFKSIISRPPPEGVVPATKP